MRPSRYHAYMKMAFNLADRATCARRKVACILINPRGQILSTGYNGPPSGWTHCTDATPCPGRYCPSGEGLDLCEAIHAEQNALLQCPNVYEIDTVICTDSPCVHCVKLLLNTSCQTIVFKRGYPHSHAKDLWVREPSRRWIEVSPATEGEDSQQSSGLTPGRSGY